MSLESLLESLSKVERDFIACLDNRNNVGQHRSALDDVISEGGILDFKSKGYWFPYEVVELGKNWLQDGHEREYAACLGIVLRNIVRGTDKWNDLVGILENQADSISQLPPELKTLIEEMIDLMIKYDR